MTNITTQPKNRYYDDEGSVNPLLCLSGLKKQIHALFTYWVADNCLPHDFIEAIEHTATLFYIDYLWNGKPDLSDEVFKYPVEMLELARFQKPEKQSSVLRFYGEDSNLNGRIDTSRQSEALAMFFIKWVADNWLARDFSQAAKDCAVSVLHDFDICKGMGGLGGGKTAEQFLTTPYKG